MKKKFLVATIAVVVFVGITACSTNEIEESNTTSETTNEVTTEASEAVLTEETSETTTEATEETEITIPELDLSTITTFEVTSENITDGVWDDIISNTDAGENMSPELSWEEIDDASMYVLYMIDISAGNWVHMKASDITVNELIAGALSSDQYIGPYPPSGTHEYTVYVFALRDNPIAVRSLLDRANYSIDEAFANLDVTEAGESGNIISYGTVSATYSAAE